MSIILPVMIISFFLESICSNFISINNSLFIPLFSIISLVIIYPYFNNDDFKFLQFCGLLGLFYDLIFTNTFIFNMVIFISIGIIIKLVNFFISNNALNIILISSITIIAYRIITYFVLCIIGYLNFSIQIVYKSIYSSLLLNIIYAFLIYLITDYFSRKYKIQKID